MKQVQFSNVKGDFIEKVLCLTCSLYNAIQQGKKVVVLDTDIFDIDHLTKALNKYKIIVTEKNLVEFKKVAVFYGKGNRIFDITDYVPDLLESETRLNTIHGDPYPDQKKELFFCYRINGIELTETYPEDRDSAIILHPSMANYIHDFFWLNKANLILYNEIMKNIRLKKTSQTKGTTHIIHVLSKEDMKQCAIQVKKNVDEFIEVAIKKYIMIIQEFITNQTDTIVLVQTEDHLPLIKFLENKGNPYKRLQSTDTESFGEVSFATGIFVGVFNMDKLTGSACSYYLHHTLPYSQSILIDIDHIYEN